MVSELRLLRVLWPEGSDTAKVIVGDGDPVPFTFGRPPMKLKSVCLSPHWIFGGQTAPDVVMDGTLALHRGHPKQAVFTVDRSNQQWILPIADCA